jgi:hypothetical protein
MIHVGRDGYRSQDSDDHHRYQQLDQRKAARFVHSFSSDV